MKTFSIVFLIVLLAVLCNCKPSSNNGKPVTGLSTDTFGQILVNQVGYHPNSAKIALLRVKTDKFDVVDDSTGKVVYTGNPGVFRYWELSGGPNTATFADCPDITRSKFPAMSFVDALCSYSTNEIAINWNAPLFFLMGAMDSLNQ